MIFKSAPTKQETYIIKRLVEEGLSAREISKKLMVQYSSVANWVQHFRKDSEPESESESDSSAGETPADDEKE